MPVPLVGLGGGVVIVPLLALVFGVDIHYALGASLISVIAFAIERDILYVVATLIVLGILVYSLFTGGV